MKRTLLAVFLMLSVVTLFAESITLMWNSRPPYMAAKDNSIEGLTAKAALAAFKNAGIECVIQETPSLRQTEEIKKNTAPLAGLGWFKNPEREGFAQFSNPIYQDKPSVVVTRKENTVVPTIKTLNALFANKTIKLLVKNGYSYGSFIDKKITELSPAVESTVVESVNMIKMIQAGRADYMFMSSEEFEVLITAAGLKTSDFSITTLSDLPAGEKRYLMLTKMVSPETMKKINAGIDTYLKENNIVIK